MNRQRIILLIAGLLLPIPAIRAQQVTINELMAANSNTLADDFGEYPDWFELYNGTGGAVDLTGFSLSDDAADLQKWTIPGLTLEAGEHRVIFASGRDTSGFSGSWNAVVTRGDVWRYASGIAGIPLQWTDVGFNDAAWAQGPTGIGLGDGDDATIIPSTLSLFARRTFTVEDPSAVERAVFHMDYDDGFVAYVNGVEVARANVGQPGTRPAYDQPADTFTEPRSVLGLPPESFAIENIASLLLAGENVLAVQVHNSSLTSSDLTCIPYLTLGLRSAPAARPPAAELASFFTQEIHTNFRLGADGEEIFLTDTVGQVVDSVRFGPLRPDVSLGRQPDGTGLWHFFEQATPGGANGTTGYLKVAPPPEFSQVGGRYGSPVSVSLSALPGAQIYYSTDGSTPSEQSIPYGAPVSINQTTVLRAQSTSPGSLPSEVVTHTFIVGENTTLPVVSISTDPPRLWDRETGIYAFPAEDYAVCPNFPHFCANFWEDREIEVNLEIFSTGISADLNIGAGIDIVGGWSRAFPQKSLGVFARGRYGSPEFRVRLFPDRPYTSYQSFILRNSGNDWDSTMLRDGFLQETVDQTEIDRMEYRPAVLYLNGEYWGIHNIREKLNEHYAAALADTGPGDVDLIALDTDQPPGVPEIVGGDAERYEQLIAYVSFSNMASPIAIETVRSMMDVDNFIDYQIAQIYIGNTDWPGNNVKLWRPRTPGGRWRWIMFDVDFGFGRWNPQDYTHNTLAFAAEPNGPDWPNPPWSTLLFRRLLVNPEFRAEFINRYADFLNVYFREDHVLSVLDSLQGLIDHEIPDHSARWGRSYDHWVGQINNLRYYAGNRPAAAESHLRSFFGLAPRVRITVATTGGGTVRVNRAMIDESPWTGYYYPNNPVPITAEPDPGYRFAAWTGSVASTDRTIRVNPLRALTLTANFEPAIARDPRVVINEIQYHAPDDMPSEDWIELLNREGEALDLSWWTLSDGGGMWTFPAGTSIGAGEFLVLARDTITFASIHPDVAPIAGGWPFGLGNGGESVYLRDDAGFVVDSVAYGDAAPWPAAADGAGSTLELLDPDADNVLPSNWRASLTRGGTPGRTNSVAVGVTPDLPLPADVTLGLPYPNPARDHVRATVATPVAGHTTVLVYDVLGRRVATLVDGIVGPGYRTIEWDAQTVPSGLYVIRLSTPDGTIRSASVIVTH